MKNIAILGSTGSIGTNSLKVIAANPEKYRVVALTAGRNIERLAEQIERFRPLGAAVLTAGMAGRLKDLLKGHPTTEIFYGTEGFIRLATLKEVDTVISAMTGAAGLVPTYAAVDAGKDIALANKETMVMAGSLVMRRAREQGLRILPVDSEHSAIFQALQGHPREDVRRVILTASGGPFRAFSLDRLAEVTPEEALRHPNWDMGRKVTIDSATLMNKGLEAIEAKWLFGLSMDQISIVIHPQSIIHSMVEYRDGSVIAQMGIPDMITPISYALSHPHHLETHLPPLRLEEVGSLDFEPCDSERFRCLALALEAAGREESMPAVLNGANEVAVNAFLRGSLRFLEIPVLIERTMEAHEAFPVDRISKVVEADRWARETASRLLRELGD